MLETITVSAEDGESRLDRWFRRHYPSLGHGRLEKLLRTGQVRVDGKRAKSGDRVSPGQAIRVPPLGEVPTAATAPPRARPQDEAAIRDFIIHRDEHAIVLNKPPGLAVQGGSNTTRHVDGMLDGLRFGDDERPRLVHRLDKDTSGVLLIARTAAAAAFFTRAFREKTTRKTYWAIVDGAPEADEGTVDAPLAKVSSAAAGWRMVVDPAGQRAVTHWRVLERGARSLVEFRPETGRTHQIRVHAASLGAPIAGDPVYGAGRGPMLLHARRVVVPYAEGRPPLDATAPLPPHWP